MSGRGGRGGGRGGRGGARGGKPAPPGMPFGEDASLIVSDEPLETYPKSYQPPLPPPLTPLEERAVECFVRFRRAYHNTPLYTHRHMDAEAVSARAPVLPMYGQAQVNARYGVKSKSTTDPFLAMPMYSHQFVDETRAIPYLRNQRPWVKDLFPEELWGTLNGTDTGGPKGGFEKPAGYFAAPAARTTASAKRKAEDEERDDEDPFADADDDEESRRKRRANETEEQRKARIEGAAGKGMEQDGDDAGEGELDDEEEILEEQDDDFEDADDDGGDYNAEGYFDAGDDDDYGEDDGGGEGAYD
ncbi:DNA-directed RNA polymerase III, subunit Rpc31 [Xylariaceae sp. FL0016]|nr:DNA-directed RNA polymerase III, subunit Rpc31 [Xylariaceae sp. FL0016]